MAGVGVSAGPEGIETLFSDVGLGMMTCAKGGGSVGAGGLQPEIPNDRITTNIPLLQIFTAHMGWVLTLSGLEFSPDPFRQRHARHQR